MKPVIFGFALISIIAMSRFRAVGDPSRLRDRAIESCEQKLLSYKPGAKRLRQFQITKEARDRSGRYVISCECSGVYYH